MASQFPAVFFLNTSLGVIHNGLACYGGLEQKKQCDDTAFLMGIICKFLQVFDLLLLAQLASQRRKKPQINAYFRRASCFLGNVHVLALLT